MKDFNLMKSEIKKAERFANKVTGKTNCKVTEYYTNNKKNNSGFIKVKCRIFSNNGKIPEGYITLLVCTRDRRKTFVE